MKKLNLKAITAILVGIVLVVASCKKDKKDNPDDKVTSGQTIETSVGGQVLNENGKPLYGANVHMGPEKTRTDDNGIFIFRNVKVDAERAYLKVTKAGYFLGSRVIKARKGVVNNVRIQLLKSNVAGTFNSTSAKTITYQGVSVKFLADAIKTESGADYNGTVKVAMQFLDPTKPNLGDIMPGDMMGLDENGDKKLLETFGMVGVELTDPSGNKLNLRDGKTAELSIPLSGAYLADAPATIPLWHFDEAAGIWKEEGKATKQGNAYVGNVSHFSFWNCDRASTAIDIFGKVVCNGVPFLNAIVTVSTMSGRRIGSNAITGADGKYNGFVPSGQQLKIRVSSLSCRGTLYESTIGPFTSTAAVADIIACNSSVSTGVFQVILKNCDGNAVSNGGVSIYSTGLSMFFIADANGVVNTPISYCAADSFTIIGFDFDDEKTSGFKKIATSNMAMGNLPICEEEFFLKLHFEGKLANDMTYTKNEKYIFGRENEIAIFIHYRDTNISAIMAWNGDTESDDRTVLWVRGASVGVAYQVDSLYNVFRGNIGDASYHVDGGGPSFDAESTVKITFTEYNAVEGGVMSGTFSGSYKGILSNKRQTLSGSFRVPYAE